MKDVIPKNVKQLIFFIKKPKRTSQIRHVFSFQENLNIFEFLLTGIIRIFEIQQNLYLGSKELEKINKFKNKKEYLQL